MSGDPLDLEQVLHDAEQGWALSTDARMALAAEVRRLRAWLEAEADWLNAAHDGSLVTSDYPMIARRMITAVDGR